MHVGLLRVLASDLSGSWIYPFMGFAVSLFCSLFFVASYPSVLLRFCWFGLGESGHGAGHYGYRLLSVS